MNSVDNLLKRSFSSRTLEEKINIKQLGRPIPDLDLIQDAHGKNRASYKRRFGSHMYAYYGWMCGCEVRNAIFCFPCLLFGNTGAMAWSRNGVKDLGHLKMLSKKHNENKTHIHNVLNLAALGNVTIPTQLSRAYHDALRSQNDKVKKNRYILSRIIDCIKFCGAFELALRGHNETEMSENPGIFLGLVDFMSSLDSAVKEHMESSQVFRGISKTIQNELLESMLQVCREKIIEEMREAEFVAIMVDETTDISEQTQLVIVFRYERHGVPCERFWGFFNPEGQNAEAISTCILGVIGKIFKDKPDKIIAQTYDGASIMSGKTGGVQAKIKSHFPNAHYIHCYAHQLNILIQKAASQITSARVFFCNLAGFPTFFSKSPQRMSKLNAVVSQRVPNDSATRWNFQSRAVNVVYENKDSLLDCFLDLEESSSSPRTVQEASGLRLYLENDEFLFWLSFFHKIMPHIDVLHNVLQARLNDTVKTKNAVTYLIQAINGIKESTGNADSEVQSGNKRRKQSHRNADAMEVCDRILQEVSHRFQSLDHLEAAKLLNSFDFPFFLRYFPDKELDSAVQSYNMLEKSKLKTELSVLYDRNDYRKIDGAVPLLQHILKNNLVEIFSELTKLLKIIVTTPMPTTEPERCFSTLKRIKTFLKNTMSQERLTALAMLSIEKKLVADMDEFNMKVIDNFCSKTERRMDFILQQ